MTIQQFIQQANQYGKAQQPFFFLIDFEQQKPQLLPLSEASKQGIYFDIVGQNNHQGQFSIPREPLELTAFPISLSQYQQGFELVQQELQKGNSYLLNLTAATEIRLNYSLEQIFQGSQAPYKLLYKDQFVCFSPECFIHIDDNHIYTYPMKGTISAEISNAEKVLLENQKEIREHYTIVDLMRNDLAMVAQQIEVRRFRYVEKIQTERGAILQTSSEICGKLPSNWQHKIGDILLTLLPAGSISGAPKEKTVDIIQQAERQERGYYTGIFGIFNGTSLRSAVAIRFIEQRQNQCFFRSGGGITIQSNLQDEYAELLQKIYIPLTK